MPAEEQIVDGAFPGGNKLYRDLRGRFTAEDALETLPIDTELVKRLRKAPPDYGWEITIEYLAKLWGTEPRFYLERGFDESPFSFLDVGVASSVVALVALGAVPVLSCNGGTVPGCHHHPHPLIAFYAAAPLEALIMSAVKRSGLEIEQSDFTNGPLIASMEIDPFLAFARILCDALRRQPTHY